MVLRFYLHYCFDLWAERWRRQEAHGDMIIVRYADDLVAGFEHEDDARRFLDAMRERVEAFALTLHSDKTRLIEFGRHAATKRKTRGLGKPETFMFLGFIHICGKSRRGNFLLERKTRRDRLRTKLQDIKAELRRRMHQPKGNFKVGMRTEKSRLRRSLTSLQELMRKIRHHAISDQVGEINAFLRGHYAYYGVAGNLRCLAKVYRAVERYWYRMLRSRSWAGRALNWSMFHQIKERTPLLKPKLRLPYGKLQVLAVL